jgi:hypothetical protein
MAVVTLDAQSPLRLAANIRSAALQRRQSRRKSSIGAIGGRRSAIVMTAAPFTSTFLETPTGTASAAESISDAPQAILPQ